MVEIIPSILTADINEAREKILELEGLVKRVQFDIVDGVFNNNKTIDPLVVETIDTSLLLDFHLMTKEPALWVEKAIRGGADRIIGQIEQMGDQLSFIGKVQEVGAAVGLAIDLDTPVNKIAPEALASLDVVLVMSVKAGFGGQEFNDQVLDKIKELNNLRLKDNLKFRICVDGGVQPEKVPVLEDLGTDEIVVGKRLFAGSLAVNLEKYTMG
jgi:ribulose-phosphate 3-epimerase